MEKWYTSKAFLKLDGGRIHTPHPNPQDPPLAISYTNHQKSLTYFSHLAPLVLLFFNKVMVKKGGSWHNAPLNMFLHVYIDHDTKYLFTF